MLVGTSTIAFADIMPTRIGTGPLSLQIPAGVAENAAGNSNIGSNVLTLADGIAPVMDETQTIIPSVVDISEQFNIKWKFDERVVGFTADDIEVTNATVVELTPQDSLAMTGGVISFAATAASAVSAAIGATEFNAIIQPDGSAEDITITVQAGAFHDINSNANTGFSTTIAVQDQVGPKVVEFNVPETFKLRQPFTATIIFDEPVFGFALADLEITEARATNLTKVSASEYAIEITPDGLYTIDLALPENTVTDAQGNGNARTEANSIKNAGNVEETLKVNAAFMSMRGRRIMTDRPDLKGISACGTKPTGAFNLTRGTDGLSGDFSAYKCTGFAKHWSAWTDLTSSFSRAQDNDMRFAMLIAGIQRNANENMTLGMTAQFDYAHLQNDSENSEVNGVGWMVGPYLVYRVPDSNLTFDLEASWGRSSNDTDPVGLYTDTFDTDRVLVSGNASLDIYQGGWTLTPSLGASYFRETQEAYIDTIGFTIPEQTVSFGDITLAFDASKGWVLKNGSVVDFGIGLAGAYSFEANTGGVEDLFTENALRPRMTGQFQWFHEGWSVDVNVFHDGLGVDPIGASGGDTYSAWGVAGTINKKF